MGLYLPVKLTPTASIGICQRCRKKMYRAELRADPNIPGLLVCKDCTDVYDPYRLPPRQVEKLVINRASLDASLSSTDDSDIQTQGSQDITTDDGVSLEE